MATAACPFPLTITTIPTRQQLQNWWQEMHTDLDDLHVAFNDFTPPTLQEFLRQDLMVMLCHLGETIAAAGWLHDVTRDDQGHVVEGWIGGWIAKPCRGQIGMASWQLVLDNLVERGVAHIHSAVNVANRRSFLFTKRMMGFTAVGVFPRLSLFRGVRTDMHILTLHAADRERAWRAAEVLAQQRWSAHEAIQGKEVHNGKPCLRA
jgi:hypothetical protein